MSHATAHVHLDATGALTAADGRLEELNARAGGAVGQPLALPSISAIATLARRLRIVVSRAATVSDAECDFDVQVRAEPDAAGGVDVAVSGWAPRPRRSSLFDAAASSEDYARGVADWRWEADDALNLTRLSDAAAGAIGGDPRAFVGGPLTQLFAFVADADGALPVLQALAAHRRFDGQLATLREGSGTFRLSAVPMTDGRGRFAGFLGSAARVDDAPASSEPANDNAFAARLDEALRSPLGRIIANAETMRAQTEGPLRADYAGYATDIASAGRHLLSLVDDLVDLHAIERPGFSPERDAIDLADIARRAAGLLGVRAANADVRIDRPSEYEEVPATGEFRRVLQILVNLIGNAVRYSPPGGAVTVSAVADDRTASITVADSGMGIAPADQSRIFDKFERVDPNEPGGTGLGLYIARRLARAMGGDLVVLSAPGAGARFTLTLPTA